MAQTEVVRGCAMPARRALLICDWVDSTVLGVRLGGARAAEVFAAHDRTARDLLAQHHGREIDKSDGFLLLFEHAADSARFALAYHVALDALSHLLGIALAARVGLHLDDVWLRANPPEDVARGAKPLEVEGTAKAVAARTMAAARGGRL